MRDLRFVIAGFCLVAWPALAQSPDSFQRQAAYGVWSRTVFADSITVSGPAKTIYLAGMGAEDEATGTILHQGDFYEQCRYA